MAQKRNYSYFRRYIKVMWRFWKRQPKDKFFLALRESVASIVLSTLGLLWAIFAGDIANEVDVSQFGFTLPSLFWETTAIVFTIVVVSIAVDLIRVSARAPASLDDDCAREQALRRRDRLVILRRNAVLIFLICMCLSYISINEDSSVLIKWSELQIPVWFFSLGLALAAFYSIVYIAYTAGQLQDFHRTGVFKASMADVFGGRTGVIMEYLIPFSASMAVLIASSVITFNYIALHYST